MKSQILGYTTVLVMLANSLMCTASSKYTSGSVDDVIYKRRYQRRNLLKSFCARRCNRGDGGNACKCNGFHFAGKRTSGYFDDTDKGSTEVPEVPNIYGVLSEPGRLLLNSVEERYNAGELAEKESEELEKSLNAVLSEILRGKITSRRTYDDALKELLDTYLGATDTDDDI